MKPNCYFKSAKLPLTIFLLFILLSSCTVYQNVPDTDGIYSSEKNRTRVIVDNSKEYQEYENNYFSKELERIDRINGTDIFTDIETYSSIEDTINNSSEDTDSYNMNNAWGSSDSEQIVINLNVNNVGYGLNNYWDFYDPYFSYGYLNPWNRMSWRYGWRGRFGDPSFWPGYGYFQLPYFNPFFSGMYGYGFFNSRNYYGNGYLNNRFRNYNYGRRSYSYNTLSSRNYTNSRRIYNGNRRVNNSNRRVTFTNRRSQNTDRDVNIDNLASRLRFDKNKIKVYSQTENVPVESRQRRNITEKTSTIRSGTSSRRSSYNSNPSRTRSNSSTRARSNTPPRSSSTRSSGYSRGSSSSRTRSSSSRSSSKRGG